MTIINELEALILSTENKNSNDPNEELNIPLDISDIISICREFNKLGWQIQQQVENIVEIGVEESVNAGYVKREALPLIKNFLRQVSNNPYFGDAVSQADECIVLIRRYEKEQGIVYVSQAN